MNLLRSWIDRGPDRPPKVLSRTFEVPIRPGGISVGSFRGPETASKSKGLHGRREREEKRESVCARGGGKIGADVADFECKQIAMNLDASTADKVW
jgi:hypothetical protein